MGVFRIKTQAMNNKRAEDCVQTATGFQQNFDKNGSFGGLIK